MPKNPLDEYRRNIVIAIVAYYLVVVLPLLAIIILSHILQRLR